MLPWGTGVGDGGSYIPYNSLSYTFNCSASPTGYVQFGSYGGVASLSSSYDVRGPSLGLILGAAFSDF